MQIAADDLKRIERLHVRAWPALETATIHGWLWRYSGGADALRGLPNSFLIRAPNPPRNVCAIASKRNCISNNGSVLSTEKIERRSKLRIVVLRSATDLFVRSWSFSG